jgi:phenylpropionate dioxygenase-like ring-hydroxylating dioxygenase large terminal subunit
MKTLIPPSFYSDPEVFKREQVVLFQNLWTFACFTVDVSNHNDYICTEIGGKSVVIQNLHGELRAFQNVCSHRFSQIRQQPQGNGILKCPYHGWVYNSDGIPAGIPHHSEFDDLTDATREALRLERWLLETCGSLIFVKRRDDGISLKDFLQPDVYEKLQRISGAIGKRIDRHQIKIQANFKIVLENTLDNYHVGAVHQQSFGKFCEADFEYFLENDLHYSYSACASKIDPKWQKKWKIIESVFADRPVKNDRYCYQLVFPSMTLVNFYGALFGFQSIQPVSPSETWLTLHLFVSKLEKPVNSESHQAMVDVLSHSFKELMRTVFDEDKAICAQVQLGISSLEDKKAGIFSRLERCVYQFQRAYLNLMNVSDA